MLCGSSISLTLILLLLSLAGDYSNSQLLRINRQALVLHKYYELLIDAIEAYHGQGAHYLVAALANRAGKTLGEETVAESTVRYWHADYVSRDGTFKPDERGHYSRELLILEEDIKQKFVKWSLRAAKTEDLSVAAARDYLNNELLASLEVRNLILICLIASTTHLVTVTVRSLFRTGVHVSGVQDKDSCELCHSVAVDEGSGHPPQQVPAELLQRQAPGRERHPGQREVHQPNGPADASAAALAAIAY